MISYYIFKVSKIFIILPLCFCMVIGCSDNSSTSSKYSGPSGLTSDQKEKYNNLSPEGKLYVNAEMKRYDDEIKKESASKLLSSVHIPPSGLIFHYSENNGKIIAVNNSVNPSDLLKEISTAYEQLQIKPVKDKWESQADYQKRLPKFSSISLPDVLAQKIDNNIFGIKLDLLSGGNAQCGHIAYSVDRKLLTVDSHYCLGESIFYPSENKNIYFACCIIDGIKISIPNSNKLIGKALKNVKGDGSLKRSNGLKIYDQVSMPIDKAKILVPEMYSLFANQIFELIFVGKIEKKSNTPLQSKTVPIDLQKIIVTRKDTGDIIWQQSVY